MPGRHDLKPRPEKMIRRAQLVIAMSLAAALTALPARAQQTALQISGGLEQTAQDYSDASYSLGYVFAVNSTLAVTALGFYDDDQAATQMTQSHQVGLFDSAGNLLVQATVRPADPYSNLFRYDSALTNAAGLPVGLFVLQAGQNYVAAAVTGTDEFVIVGPSFGGSLGTDPAVTFVEDRTYAPATDGSGSHNASTLVFPNFSSHNDYFGDGSTNDGYFGPNFQFIPAPEPAPMLALGLGALGLGALGLRRRLTNFRKGIP